MSVQSDPECRRQCLGDIICWDVIDRVWVMRSKIRQQTDPAINDVGEFLARNSTPIARQLWAIKSHVYMLHELYQY